MSSTEETNEKYFTLLFSQLSRIEQTLNLYIIRSEFQMSQLQTKIDGLAQALSDIADEIVKVSAQVAKIIADPTQDNALAVQRLDELTAKAKELKASVDGIDGVVGEPTPPTPTEPEVPAEPTPEL